MNKTKIEWADFTWNPIVGCKHGCSYCYAKKINDRFHFIQNWNEPEIMPAFTSPDFSNVKIPKKRNRIAAQISPDKPIVFVGSMTDIFGEWNSDKFIHSILHVCAKRQDILFMFLTKNSKRILKFDKPNNCYFGITVANNTTIHNSDYFDFVSIEPILSEFDLLDNEMFNYYNNFLIIGALTGCGKIDIEQTKKNILSVKHDKIYYKDSALKILEANNE